jgi:glucose/arabinose dehydrogenase
MYRFIIGLSLFLSLSGCEEKAQLPIEKGTGPNPELPSPRHTLVPTVKIADVDRWRENEAPKAFEGRKVTAFARDLDHPRWLYVLPNGDVLVAETNAPVKPNDNSGLKGFFAKLFMKKAGAVTLPANRITLLRDTNADGVADLKTIFLSGLNSPFGMALVGDRLFVANTDSIISVPYTRGDTKITTEPQFLSALPAGPLNHHWTKGLIASVDGHKLYASIGSNSNMDTPNN